MHYPARHPRCALWLATSFFAALLRAEVPAVPADTATAAYAPKAPETVSLKETYKNSFHVGVALNPRQFNGQNAEGAALVLKEFDSISPENALKWESVEPGNGGFRFEQADQYVEFGVKHKMFIIGHNLVWHSQLPLWVSEPARGETTLTREVLLQRLRNHIMTVAGRYRGKINGWDVLNEAVNDKGGYRESVFYRVIGKEYIPMIFKWAREADPHAELYYNDYNLDASDAKRATTIELIKYLQEQGAPIDGIGMQGHYNLNHPSPAKIDETIRMFSALGLKVMITELDVQVNRNVNAAITGAVGVPTEGNAPAQSHPPRAGAAEQESQARSRAITADKPLPGIDAFKNNLVLTAGQAAKIAPLLEADAREQAAAASDKPKLGEIRAGTISAIRALLTDEQPHRLTLLLNPPAGGGRPVSPPPPPLTEAEQQALAKRYREIFAVFLKNRPALTRVTFWGLRDSDSWRRNSSPLLFDDNYQRKPAYDAVIQVAKEVGNVSVAKP
jgi:endo-1,4-beta-xylanase